MDTCKPYAEAKAKLKILTMITDVVKMLVRPKTMPKQVNERINLNWSMIKAPAGVKVTVTKPQWLMVVDKRTEMKWFNFFVTKNGMVDHVCCWFQKMEG